MTQIHHRKKKKATSQPEKRRHPSTYPEEETNSLPRKDKKNMYYNIITEETWAILRRLTGSESDEEMFGKWCRIAGLQRR